MCSYFGGCLVVGVISTVISISDLLHIDDEDKDDEDDELDADEDVDDDDDDDDDFVVFGAICI